MKRIVICCILTAVIFAGGITGLIYTSKTCEYLTENLHQVVSCYEQEDMEGAKAAAERVSDRWKSFRRLHILITDNDHSLEITMAAERIERLLELEDDEVKVECGVMERLVSDYYREQEIRVGNVF